MTLARQLTEAISRNAGKPITIRSFARSGSEMHISVTPEQRGDRGMIGISFANETEAYQAGPIEAMRLSVERNCEIARLIFKTLGGLFIGRRLLGS